MKCACGGAMPWIEETTAEGEPLRECDTCTVQETAHQTNRRLLERALDRGGE